MIERIQGQNLINNQWTNDSVKFIKINPCTETEMGKIPLTSKSEVDKAIKSAREAFSNWKALSRVKRAEYFDNLAQLIKQNYQSLVDLISYETGKNVNESHAEVMEALHMIQFTAGKGREPCGSIYASEVSSKDINVIRKPKGVIAVISPWNFPLAIGSTWCSAPAILEGNTVVHKPSEHTPFIAQKMAELYLQAGFPSGVYNLIHGADETGSNLINGDVDSILFTGSSEVGRKIRQHCSETWHKSCVCEMGSKSAMIIFPDGNMDIAVESSIASAFKLSGQRCVSAGRILVHEQIFDQFVDRFVMEASKLKTGPPDVQGNYYGPLINLDQMNRVLYYNDLVRKDKGSDILLDGGRVNDVGYFINPFVYVSRWSNKPFLKEEVFGPHVAIIPFSNTQEAFDIFNDTDYGLSVGIITNNFRLMRECQQNIDVGMMYFNLGSIGAESHIPFGGIKRSGFGGKSAAGMFECVSEEIAVTTNFDNKVIWAQGMK